MSYLVQVIYLTKTKTTNLKICDKNSINKYLKKFFFFASTFGNIKEVLNTNDTIITTKDSHNSMPFLDKIKPKYIHSIKESSNMEAASCDEHGNFQP